MGSEQSDANLRRHNTITCALPKHFILRRILSRIQDKYCLFHEIIMASTPVVLVTGAAGGIGFEIVRTLIEELDCRVVANDIVKGELEKLSASYTEKLELVVGDICDVGDHRLTK